MQYRYRLIVPTDRADEARRLVAGATWPLEPDEPPADGDGVIFDIYSRAVWPLGFVMRWRVDRQLRGVAVKVGGNLTRMPVRTLYSPTDP